MIKRIIITGGPSSGKTSIIDALKDEGYSCFDEVSREIIQEMNIKTAFKNINFAYLKKNKHEIPTHIKIDCENHRYYPTVFITTPWEDIYTVDDERLESFKDSIQIFQTLKKVYVKANYNLVELPQSSVKERIRFIINKI